MKSRLGVKMVSYFVVTMLLVTTMVSGILPAGISKANALTLPAGSTNLATGMSVVPISEPFSGPLNANYSNGVFNSVAANSTGTDKFCSDPNHPELNLGMGTSDTYVFSSNVTLQKTDAVPFYSMGMAFRGANTSWEYMFCFTSDNTVGIYYNSMPTGVQAKVQVAQVGFSVEYSKAYQVSIKSWPDKVSVWIDGQLIFDQVSLAVTAFAPLTGAWSANSTFSMDNINIFKDSDADYPGAKLAPIMSTGAVDYGSAVDPVVYNGSSLVPLSSGPLNATYQNGVLTDTNNGNMAPVVFNNVPLAASDTYVYSFDETFTNYTDPNQQSPRMIFRYANQDWIYSFFFYGNQAIILHEGWLPGLTWQGVASTTFNRDFSKASNIVIKSSPNDVSVWVNGQVVFNNVPIDSGYPAQAGAYFANIPGQFDNIHIYKTNDLFSDNDVTANTISNVNPGTSVANFLDTTTIRNNTTFNFSSASGSALGQNDLVGTGTTVKYYVGGTLTGTYSALVYGDVNGDGKIDLNDLALIRDDLTGVSPILQTFEPAGDLYNEGSITLNDLVGIMADISGSGNISQTPFDRTT